MCILIVYNNVTELIWTCFFYDLFIPECNYYFFHFFLYFSIIYLEHNIRVSPMSAKYLYRLLPSFMCGQRLRILDFSISVKDVI